MFIVHGIRLNILRMDEIMSSFGKCLVDCAAETIHITIIRNWVTYPIVEQLFMAWRNGRKSRQSRNMHTTTQCHLFMCLVSELREDWRDQYFILCHSTNKTFESHFGLYVTSMPVRSVAIWINYRWHTAEHNSQIDTKLLRHHQQASELLPHRISNIATSNHPPHRLPKLIRCADTNVSMCIRPKYLFLISVGVRPTLTIFVRHKM